MNRSAEIYTCQGQGHFHSHTSGASCSQAPSENGYHSEVNHFSTGCLLMLWRNND